MFACHAALKFCRAVLYGAVEERAVTCVFDVRCTLLRPDLLASLERSNAESDSDAAEKTATTEGHFDSADDTHNEKTRMSARGLGLGDRDFVSRSWSREDLKFGRSFHCFRSSDHVTIPLDTDWIDFDRLHSLTAWDGTCEC